MRSHTFVLFVWVSCTAVFSVAPRALAIPSITLGPTATNAPPPLQSTGITPPETAIADVATLIPVATFAPVLQATLDAQGYTAANRWTLVDNAVPLDGNATFNVTQYSLSNGDGSGFGEEIDFSLSPNPAAPVAPPGTVVTEHWLQFISTDSPVNGYGFAIAGLPGLYQLDNGQIDGGPAAGAASGPYYDSFAPPDEYSTPPDFHDFPHYYAGVGTYLHFDDIPTWDLYTPASGNNPATESIDVGSYGFAYGFTVVPEPANYVLMLGIGVPTLLRRRRSVRSGI